MSHINSFLDAPLHPDRGRRLIPKTSLYQHPKTGDYLHDHRPLADQITPPIGTTSTPHPLRFHRGFYRRSEATIGVGAARQAAEAERERRCEEVGKQRRAVLTERQKGCEDERSLLPRRRHFPAHTTTTTLLPQPTTSTTPSLPSTPPSPAPFSTTSRIIGGAVSGGQRGGGDVLGSYGVLDNFMGDGYGKQDWQPPRMRRPVKGGERGGRSGSVEVGGGGGGGEEKREVVLGLSEAKRERQVEYVRNARQGSQLSYLFGSAAERAESV